MGTWLEACKAYAAKSGKWCVPKKDTAEYAEIKKIAEGMKAKGIESKPIVKKNKKGETVVVKAAPVEAKVPETEPAPAPAPAAEKPKAPRRKVLKSAPETAEAPSGTEAAPAIEKKKRGATRKVTVKEGASVVDGPVTVTF